MKLNKQHLIFFISIVNVSFIHTAEPRRHRQLPPSPIKKFFPSPPKWGALHDAAVTGNAKKIYELFNPCHPPHRQTRPANPNRLAPGKVTALHLAVEHNKLEAIEALLKNPRTHINLLDEKGNTPLHLAKSREAAELLLVKKAQTRLLNNSGQTALEVAELSVYKGVSAAILESKNTTKKRVEIRNKMEQQEGTQAKRSKLAVQEHSSAEETCPSCLEITTPENSVILYECAHLIHIKCEIGFRKFNIKTCPICSAPFKIDSNPLLEKTLTSVSEEMSTEDILRIALEDPDFIDD